VDGLPATPGGIVSEEWLRTRRNVLHLPEKELGKATVENSEYPIAIPWNGILVDDPSHPDDLTARVRHVLRLLWADAADEIEREACELLGFESLRAYFHNPSKGFFDFHAASYSMSSRRAPIYWLLQSQNRTYAIWLYYHRLDGSTLYAAGRDYADAKVQLERGRLETLQLDLAGLAGAARRRRERQVERQVQLLEEVTQFRDTLDRIALQNLIPDHDDGVQISIAPLWKLVPWQYAERTWKELCAGEHEWSHMSQQMRGKGLVKA
jgi:hypothetical protein